MILLDTHVFVWLARDDVKLGRQARRRIEAERSKGGVTLSAASYLEVGTLVERGRLRLSEPLQSLRARTLEAGIKELVIDAPIAMLASQLRAFHGDPIDRILVATAMEHDAVLVTADQVILGWRTGLRSLDAGR
jgi:PIN domain nuclease of toxin-antitoxin system